MVVMLFFTMFLEILSTFCLGRLFSFIQQFPAVDFLKNIASRDAYFSLFATVVGSFIGYGFARRSETAAARNRIARLRHEFRYNLVLIKRERSGCLSSGKLSSYRDRVKSLYDSMIEFDVQLFISNRKSEHEKLQPFISAVRSHLFRAIDGYEFRDDDEKLLEIFGEFLTHSCPVNKNFLSRLFDNFFDKDLGSDQREFLQKYCDEFSK